jgi:phosphoglycerate dehydrogenase-like enzyme
MRVDALTRMKSGTILINSGRGGLVYQPTMAAALSSSHIADVRLDLFEAEHWPPPIQLFSHPTLL